jgi:hypothetical protein
VERLAQVRHTSVPGTRDDGDVRLRQHPKPLFEREDVDAIVSGLFDIRRELIRIRVALEEDEDGEEEEEDPAS